MEAAFNEREAVKKLKRAEFDEEQSDAIVEIVGDARAGLATNADIRELKAGIRQIQENMTTKAELQNMATKAELQRELRLMFAGIVVYGIALLGAAKLLFS